MERTIAAGFAMSPQVALGKNHLLSGSAKLCRRHLLWTKLPVVANVCPPGLALKAVCGGLRWRTCIFLLFIYLFICVLCEYFDYKYLCVPHVYLVFEKVRRALDPLELERLGAASWVLGTEPESSARAANAFLPLSHLSNPKTDCL